MDELELRQHLAGQLVARRGMSHGEAWASASRVPPGDLKPLFDAVAYPDKLAASLRQARPDCDKRRADALVEHYVSKYAYKRYDEVAPDVHEMALRYAADRREDYDTALRAVRNEVAVNPNERYRMLTEEDIRNLYTTLPPAAPRGVTRVEHAPAPGRGIPPPSEWSRPGLIQNAAPAGVLFGPDLGDRTATGRRVPDEEARDERHRKAIHYATEHHCSYDEALNALRTL